MAIDLSSAVIYSAFQGDLRVDTQQVIVKPDTNDHERPHFDIDRGQDYLAFCGSTRLMPLPEIKSVQSPFLFLALDLPPPPLFQDAVEKNILPQVTLASVLAKYDGDTTQVSVFVRGQFDTPQQNPNTGIRGSIETLSLHPFAPLYHIALQAFHQK
jgi:hypothetical protein